MDFELPDFSQDFKDYATGTVEVTVTSIDPDTGTALATSSGVTGLKRPRKGFRQNVGSGGEVGAETCRWLLAAGDLDFTPKPRDRVTDPNGVVWEIDAAELIAFEGLVRCDATVRKR